MIKTFDNCVILRQIYGLYLVGKNEQQVNWRFTWLAYGADWGTPNHFVSDHCRCCRNNARSQKNLRSPNLLHKPARVTPQLICCRKPGNLFLQKFEKWQTFIFGPIYCWDSLVSEHLGPLLLKVVLSQILFNGYIFGFLGYSVGWYILSYLPVKQIWRKSVVSNSTQNTK